MKIREEWRKASYASCFCGVRLEGGATVLQRARELGLKVLCGTDSGNSPVMPYGELHANEPGIMVKYGGYTPLEAISACTRDNAFVVGLEDDLGVIEAGKLADMLILDKDPVADISVLKGGRHVQSVIKAGKVVDRDELRGDAARPLGFLPGVC